MFNEHKKDLSGTFNSYLSLSLFDSSIVPFTFFLFRQCSSLLVVVCCFLYSRMDPRLRFAWCPANQRSQVNQRKSREINCA